VTNTPARIDGARVLELGPGIHFGAVIGLAGRGAMLPVYVADRWISPWRKDYHPAVYRRMAELAGARGDEGARLAYSTIAFRGYEGRVKTVQRGAEDLRPIPDRWLDMVFSNACLEHLSDHEAGARELYRITAPGGWQFHQVDYRYHDDFSRPLDHLLMAPQDFAMRNRAANNELGTQLRYKDHQAMFERAGFETFGAFVQGRAEQGYLDGIMQKVDGDPESVGATDVLFILRRPEGG
jgi:SAM-dependent methyltransferase